MRPLDVVSSGCHNKKAFEELKERFTTEPVLVTPDLNKEMRVEANASDFATGGVLSIKGKDGKWRLVVYISKLLNEAERNYEVYDKEMLVIIQCLEAWRHFLEGVKFTNGRLSVFFILLFIFIFILFYFLFSIFRTTRVRTDQLQPDSVVIRWITRLGKI